MPAGIRFAWSARLCCRATEQSNQPYEAAFGKRNTEPANYSPCFHVGIKRQGTSEARKESENTLAYLRITRAKKLVVLIRQKKALGIAIHNRRPQRQHSGLLATLRSCGQADLL
jgi:hypothetical protein